jgi:hypothetical protein
MMKMFALPQLEPVAEEVEAVIKEMMQEAAGVSVVSIPRSA